MANKSISINLVGKRDKGFADKFIKWALSIGRLVVILTEGIALATFLYRFTLDRQIIDLHDKISQKQAIIKYLKPNEDKYRLLQSKLTIIGDLSNLSSQTVDISNNFIQNMSQDIIFNNLIMSPNYIKFEAKTQSINLIASLINNLKTNPKIASVSLDRIQNQTSSSTITVGISALLKK